MMNILTAFILVMAAVGCFFITHDRVDVYDALVYHFSIEADLAPDNIKTLHSYSDIFQSQVEHYKVVNGRFPLHYAIQLFTCLWGKTTYAWVNSCVFILFVFLLKTYLFRNSRNPWSWLIIVLTLFFMFPAVTGSNMGPWFDVVAGTNYLWGGVLFIGTLICWKQLDREDDITVPGVILTGLLGFFTGWSNEAFSIPLSGAMFLYYLFISRSLPKGLRAVLTYAVWIGTLLIIVAPGTWVRFTNDSGEGGYYLIKLMDCYLGVKLFWLLLLELIILLSIRSLSLHKMWSANKFLILVFAVSLAFSFVAHSYPHSLTVLEILSFILMVRAIHCSEIRISGKVSQSFSSLLLCLLVTILTSVYLYGIDKDNRIGMEAYNRELEDFRNSPDGLIIRRSPQQQSLTGPYVCKFNMFLTPDHYCALPFAYMAGDTTKRPMELTEREFEALTTLDSRFFSKSNMIPGNARMYSGDQYYITPVDSINADYGEVVAKFDNPVMNDSVSWIRRIVYGTLGVKKKPKVLRSFILHTRNGDFIMASRVNTPASEIDFKSKE